MITHIGFRRYAVRVDSFLKRWWLVTSVSLMFACILFGRLSGRLYYSDYHNGIEAAVAVMEREFNTISDIWLDTTECEDASFVWRDSSLVRGLRSYNSGVFLFERDSLVYWSKSPMDTPAELLATDTTRQFVFLGNKVLLPMMRQAGDRKAISLINLSFYSPSKNMVSSATESHLLDTRRYAIVPYSTKGYNIHSSDGSLLFGIEPRKIDRNLTLMEYIGLLGFFIFCYGITLTAIRLSRRFDTIAVILIASLTIAALRFLAVYTGFPSSGSFWFSPHSDMNKLFATESFHYFTIGNVFVDTFLLLIVASMAARLKARISRQVRFMARKWKILSSIAWLPVSSLFLIWQIYLISRFIYANYYGKDLINIFSFDLQTFVIYLMVVAQITIYILFYSLTRALCDKRMVIFYSCARPAIVITLMQVWHEYFFGLENVAIFFIVSLAVTQLAGALSGRRIHFSWYVLIMAGMLTSMIFHNNRNHLNALQQDAAARLAVDEQYANNTLYSFLLTGDTPLVKGASAYSFVKVMENHIVEYNGEYIYGRSMVEDESGYVSPFYESSHYKHFIYRDRNNRNTFSVVSRQNVTFLNKLTLFVYIFIMLLAGETFFLGFSVYVPLNSYFKAGIYSRVRVTVMGVIVATGGIILWAVSQFFVDNQRLDLSTKMFNTSFYVNSDYRNSFSSAPDSADYEALAMWAEQGERRFHANINVFDRNGDLIAASSPLALENKIVPRKINPDIFNLGERMKTKVVHEKAGVTDYLSLYTLFRHGDGTRSYLNIVFLDSDNKPTSLPLVINILNIFVLALTVGLLVSLFLYKQIMRPLNLIGQSIRDIRYRRRITGYRHKHGSELDLLIEQYNNTVSDLEASYEELARREREGAWKILAQQIAHEIKNPLTPIKLKVQMLQRRKAKGDADWAADIDDSLKAIVSQIDVLSGIVSEFSNFAKMNMKPLERVDLTPLMADILHLYLTYPDVTVVYHDNVSPETPWVMLDAGNFRSVIVNIMVNAIYAVGGVDDPTVEVSFDKVDGGYEVNVKDNGIGIKDEDKEMIFRPSFTTKKTGSGIGLTISRQIMKNMNGDIRFTSVYGEGTTFTVFVPFAE